MTTTILEPPLKKAKIWNGELIQIQQQQHQHQPSVFNILFSSDWFLVELSPYLSCVDVGRFSCLANSINQIWFSIRLRYVFTKQLVFEKLIRSCKLDVICALYDHGLQHKVLKPSAQVAKPIDTRNINECQQAIFLAFSHGHFKLFKHLLDDERVVSRQTTLKPSQFIVSSTLSFIGGSGQCWTPSDLLQEASRERIRTFSDVFLWCKKLPSDSTREKMAHILLDHGIKLNVRLWTSVPMPSVLERLITKHGVSPSEFVCSPRESFESLRILLDDARWEHWKSWDRSEAMSALSLCFKAKSLNHTMIVIDRALQRNLHFFDHIDQLALVEIELATPEIWTAVCEVDSVFGPRQIFRWVCLRPIHERNEESIFELLDFLSTRVDPRLASDVISNDKVAWPIKQYLLNHWKVDLRSLLHNLVLAVSRINLRKNDPFLRVLSYLLSLPTWCVDKQLHEAALHFGPLGLAVLFGEPTLVHAFDPTPEFLHFTKLSDLIDFAEHYAPQYNRRHIVDILQAKSLK